CFAFEREQRRVGVYSFYLYDPEFGPGFIKICTHFPYPAKVWLNGHEWAKRQAERAGTTFRALSNGFASCDHPARLQAICDRFCPADVEAFFDRWMAVIPTPLTAFRSRVFTSGSEVRLEFRSKHSRVKQYLKDGRALGVETVINKPSDIGVRARLQHLPELVAKARQVNRRVLIIERAGQSCAIGSALFERIHQPYARGDERAMALAGALCPLVHAVAGFTNKNLRGQ